MAVPILYSFWRHRRVLAADLWAFFLPACVLFGGTAAVSYAFTGDLLAPYSSEISAQWSAIDLDCFEQYGLDPRDFDIILLRSKTHFRELYEPLCAEIVIIDTPDWGPAELANLPYEYLPAGVYPVSA